MGKMNELEMMVKELRECGAKLLQIADEMAEMFSASKQNKVEEKPKKKFTLTEVRAIMAEKSRAGYTKEMKSLLIKHGADKLSAIDPEEYEALVSEVEAIGNE